jgi:hypothetical protein
MALVEKVEVGFDLTTAGGPFLTLNDPIAGQLDNPAWPLGGLTFYDITSRVRSYSIRRGKSRQLDTFQAGVASVVLNNNDRAFDPTFAASPFYGQIIPKREIRITSNSLVQYKGLIDDWNLDYAPQGDSTALAASSDAFSQLANQTLTGGTATLQLSGARINTILSSTDVEWPAESRAIDSGEVYMGADVIPADANALTYLQTVERSEGGRFFVGKSGNITFKDQNGVQPDSASMLTLADDGTGIKYTGMQVVYGSELLYNQVVASSIVAGGTAIANDTDSQQAYGVQTLTYTDLLSAYNADVDALAVNLVKQYSAPEFRFEAVTVNLDEISDSQATQVLGLEIGSVCNIKFTPNNIAPAIQKYAEVISISHSADVRKHSVTLGFSTLDYIGLILNDAVFGKLDTATVG